MLYTVSLLDIKSKQNEEKEFPSVVIKNIGKEWHPSEGN